MTAVTILAITRARAGTGDGEGLTSLNPAGKPREGDGLGDLGGADCCESYPGDLTLGKLQGAVLGERSCDADRVITRRSSDRRDDVIGRAIEKDTIPVRL